MYLYKCHWNDEVQKVSEEPQLVFEYNKKIKFIYVHYINQFKIWYQYR